MIPSFEEFMLPILIQIQDGLPVVRDELRERCIKYMSISKQDLQERIKSNRKYKIVDRIQWATYYLLKAGLISRPSKATEQITSEGTILIQILQKQGITSINRQYLREHYESYRKFEKETRDSAKNRKIEKNSMMSKINSYNEADIEVVVKEHVDCIENNNTNSEAIIQQMKTSPQIQKFSSFEDALNDISRVVSKLEQGVIDELQGIINDFDKEVFKNLLLELIPKMGYSSSFEEYQLDTKMNHEVTLSGFVNIDELGIQKFLVVAHNKVDEIINLIDIQSLIGILSNIGVNAGVYITTSSFSSEVYSTLSYGQIKIILIDGKTLARLMMKHNIGVITRKSYDIKDVDQEYLFTHLIH